MSNLYRAEGQIVKLFVLFGGREWKIHWCCWMFVVYWWDYMAWL